VINNGIIYIVGDVLIGVYRINYTVIGEDHSFTDHFFARDLNEIKQSIVELMNDYDATYPHVAEGCIYATGVTYDLMITVESTNIFDEEGLQALLTI